VSVNAAKPSVGTRTDDPFLTIENEDEK